jgi:hypothetical protein
VLDWITKQGMNIASYSLNHVPAAIHLLLDISTTNRMYAEGQGYIENTEIRCRSSIPR